MFQVSLGLVEVSLGLGRVMVTLKLEFVMVIYLATAAINY